MNPRNNLLILFIVAILFISVFISGCTTTPGAAEPSGPPKVSASEQNLTISGSQDGQATLTMAKAGYLVSVKSKDGKVNMSTQVMGKDISQIQNGSASLEKSGWYEQQFIKHWNIAGDNTFKIKASAPYTIEWIKLPSRAATISPPQTFSDKGQKALGPIKLIAGAATITLSCPDAKNASFNVVLYNANTGTAEQTIGNNTGTGAFQNSYSATKTVDIVTAGDYYIEVTANSDAGWKVTVSQ